MNFGRDWHLLAGCLFLIEYFLPWIKEVEVEHRFFQDLGRI